MDIDFTILTLNDFRNEALIEIEKYNPELLNSISACTITTPLEDILIVYRNEQVQRLHSSLCYIWALVILKLSEDPQLHPNCLEFFSWVEYFIAWKPKYSPQVWSSYSTHLITVLSQSSDSEIIFLTDKLLKYKNILELEDVFRVLKCNLIKIFWVYFKEFNLNFSFLNTKKLLHILDYLIYIDEGQANNMNQTIESVLMEVSSLHESDQVISNQELIQILGLVDKFVHLLNPNNLSSYKGLKEKLGIGKKYQFDPNPHNLTEVKFINFECADQPFYSKKCQEFTVSAYKAVGTTPEREKKNIVVKVYTYFSGAFRASIDKEIKILTFLSNHRHENQMFLIYYGSQLSEKECYLYMEDGGKSLMDFISERRASNQPLEPQIIEDWVLKLVSTFAWLSSLSIYHRDIKPHNILVSENQGHFQLKIIDFNVSLQLTEPECTYEQGKIMLIQGTVGYMAPELVAAIYKGEEKIEHKPGKADVFSLGLTILQLITFENYDGLNKYELNHELKKKVEEIKCAWYIKNMLGLMLEKDYMKRISFKRCMGLFDMRTLDIF